MSYVKDIMVSYSFNVRKQWLVRSHTEKQCLSSATCTTGVFMIKGLDYFVCWNEGDYDPQNSIRDAFSELENLVKIFEYVSSRLKTKQFKLGLVFESTSLFNKQGYGNIVFKKASISQFKSILQVHFCSLIIDKFGNAVTEFMCIDILAFFNAGITFSTLLQNI